eukprot:m.94830 g.94830  ORF g.94830 m.94830 type:complete len:252 (-) comp15005_c0_seq6:92-847(-)
MAEWAQVDRELSMTDDQPALSLNARRLFIDAVQQGDVSTLNNLAAQLPCLVNTPIEDGGVHAIHLAAASNQPFAVEALCHAGADVQATDALGEMPLHRAAQAGAHGVVELLVQMDPNSEGVNVPDRQGWSPLHHAVARNDRPLCEWLLSHGGDVNAQARDGLLPTAIAIRHSYIELGLLLADQPDMDITLIDLSNKTLLHTAAVRTQEDTRLGQRGCEVVIEVVVEVVMKRTRELVIFDGGSWLSFLACWL